MRLFPRSATNNRPLESIASECGLLNSPGPLPSFPHALINLPSAENFTIRAFDPGPCPSATKISPFGAISTSLGLLNVSGPSPATPALPSVSNTFPSWLNSNTWSPFPFSASPSVTHTLLFLSTKRPWGRTIIPAPKLFTKFPEESNFKTGARLELAQEVPPHRSTTQMLLPSRSISALITCPQVRPSGSLAQFSTVRYGLGAEFVSAWAFAVAPHKPAITTEAIPIAKMNRFECDMAPS